MIHPSLYLIQIATEWCIFRRQWCARTLDIYYHFPPLVCDVPTTFTVVLKSQVPNDFKSKQKTRERPPIKRWESGLLRLYIAPVSAYLRWYDTYNVNRRQTWTREHARKQKTAIKKWWTYNTITTTKITQGTAEGDKNVVARILAWQYAEDIDKLARTQDTYSFWPR